MRRLVFGVIFAFLTLYCLAQTSDWFSRRGRRAPEPSNIEVPEVGPPTNEYTFARLVYSGGNGWHYDSWTTDSPKADVTFVAGIKRLTNLDVRESPFFIPLTSQEIFKYPFIYAVEVGYLHFSDEEAATLREYLLRGGFLAVDDFHGTYEWANWEEQLRKVFPDCKIEEIPLSDPIFHCFFDLHELIQIPGVQYLFSGRPYEKDGYVPHYRGVKDENGRLMVVMTFNSDIGDAWEWADYPAYPEKWSSSAYRLGINYIIYAMSH